MQAESHNSIGMIESLLDSISVMHIYVDIEHPGIDFQQLQYTDNNIVDIAEPTGLRFLGMVIASRPVDGRMRLPTNDEISSIETAADGQFTEIVESIETGAVKSAVDFIHFIKLLRLGLFIRE